MSHYNASFYSDEELLEELNKLGYDDVSPDVFSMMKEDLTEMVKKDQSDQPVSEYEYDIASQLPSNFSSTSSDGFIEDRVAKDSSRMSSTNISRKTKKKSPKTKSHVLSNPDSGVYKLESNRAHDTVDELDMKSSSYESLDYRNNYDENVLPDIDDSADNYDNMNEVASNANYLLKRSRDNCNKNEDSTRKSRVSKIASPKDKEFKSNYYAKNDKQTFNQAASVASHRSKPVKESKLSNVREKSHEEVHTPTYGQKAVIDDSMKAVKDAFKAFQIDKSYSESNESLHSNYQGSDINLNSSSSTSGEKKTIKRKVLRRRNGRSIITEELVEIPSIFDTSYPDSENFNSSKSFSSDDLSYKSNNSTGSVATVSPEASIKSSPSTLSLVSTRSTSLRVSNSRKKKSDPVAMYGYYRKFWDNFKPPGENTHDRLRWAVRDKMLEYNI